MWFTKEAVAAWKEGELRNQLRAALVFAPGDPDGADAQERMETMTKHRSHSVAFKRQLAEEFLASETLHGLSKRHDVSRQLIRIWVGKFEAGALDDDVQAADLLQEYEAKIAALERMVARQALEIKLLKGALKNAPRPRSATTSVVTGPPPSPSKGGAS